MAHQGPAGLPSQDHLPRVRAGGLLRLRLPHLGCLRLQRSLLGAAGRKFPLHHCLLLTAQGQQRQRVFLHRPLRHPPVSVNKQANLEIFNILFLEGSI